MSDDLVARLRHAWDERERQLDEDERVALAAIADDGGQDGGFEDAAWLDNNIPGQYNFGRDAANMIRRFAVPRRVLAEVERGRRDIAAKRSILDEHEGLANGACDRCTEGMYTYEQQVWPCTTVRLLAEAEGLA